MEEIWLSGDVSYSTSNRVSTEMGDVYSTKPYRPNQRMAPFATDLILCIFFFFLCPVFHYHLKTLEKQT